MMKSSSKQQKLQHRQYNNTLHSSGSKSAMAGIYKYIYVRRAAAHSIIIIYQVQVLCCETAHGVYVTKKETTLITAAVATAAPCI